MLLFYPFSDMVAQVVTKFGPGDPHEITNFISSLDPETVKQITSSQELTDPRLIALQTHLFLLQVSVSYGLSLFHTMFNLCNIVIMIWFRNPDWG